MGINVLSLFDGMSCGRIALERAGIEVDNYYASEIDKWAVKVSQDNYPDIIQLGDINNYESWDIDWNSIDLIIGGSPCQSISNLGNGSGLDGKSGLFFKFVECRKKAKNAKFLLENVVGNKKAIEVMNGIIGVQPIMINSNLVSAQNRKRYYWTDIEDIGQPTNKGVVLKDILEEGIPKDSILSPGRERWLFSEKGQNTVSKGYAVIDPNKANCITARSDASWNSNYVTREGVVTRLTPIEYERLQTVPDNYTSCVSNSQRYKMLGNGWTVDVIAHILKNF